MNQNEVFFNNNYKKVYIYIIYIWQSQPILYNIGNAKLYVLRMGYIYRVSDSVYTLYTLF